MATRSYDKEYLLCFTLAYFAEFPNYTNPEHAEEFENLFSTLTYRREYPGIAKPGDFVTKKTLAAIRKTKAPLSVAKAPRKTETILRRRLGSHLSRTFDFDKIFEKFANTVTASSGALSVKDSVRKVYNQVRNLASSDILPIRKFKDYEFLDQNDPFTLLVKNASIKKIAESFGLKTTALNPELLSSADIFIVHKNKKSEIINDIKKHLVNAPIATVLGNMVTHQHSYRTMCKAWMKEGALFGVSHKLPTTITGAKPPSIVGETTYGVSSTQKKAYNEFIDPFGQLLGILMLNPQDIGTVFDKVIDIEFKNFDIRENIGSWTMPIRFHYERVFPQYQLETAHLPNSIRLMLLNWKDAGFNGKWEIDAKTGAWIGGIGGKQSFTLFDKYDRTILNEIIEIRLKIFKQFFGSPPDDPKVLEKYNAVRKHLAIRELFRPKKAASRDINALISALKMTFTYKEFVTAITREFLKQLPKSYVTERVTDQFTSTHAAHAQLAYFMYRGGKTHQIRLKKMIAMTIYGLISKSAYKIFQETSVNTYEVKSYFQHKFNSPQGTEMIAEFHGAPYLLIG
jgi:hypothetical protein